MQKRNRRLIETFTHTELRFLLNMVEKDIMFSREKAASLVDEWREIYEIRVEQGCCVHTKLLNMFRQTEPAARGK